MLTATIDPGAKNHLPEVSLQIVSRDGTRRYRGTASVCPVKVCECTDLYSNLTSEHSITNRKSEIEITFNVFQKCCLPGGNRIFLSSNNPGKTLEQDLTGEDWRKLQRAFLDAKGIQLTTFDPDLDIVPFPFEEIEEKRKIVSIARIFPYVELPGIKLNRKTYAIEDMYCLTPDCPCTKVTLAGIRPKELDKYSPRASFTLIHDFRKDCWTDARGNAPCGADRKFLDALIHQEVLPQDMLSQRHDTLRRIYQNSRDRIHHPTRTDLPIPGTSAPCFCGSGKKFRECCGDLTSTI